MRMSLVVSKAWLTHWIVGAMLAIKSEFVLHDDFVAVIASKPRVFVWVAILLVVSYFFLNLICKFLIIVISKVVEFLTKGLAHGLVINVRYEIVINFFCYFVHIYFTCDLLQLIQFILLCFFFHLTDLVDLFLFLLFKFFLSFLLSISLFFSFAIFPTKSVFGFSCMGSDCLSILFFESKIVLCFVLVDFWVSIFVFSVNLFIILSIFCIFPFIFKNVFA